LKRRVKVFTMSPNTVTHVPVYTLIHPTLLRLNNTLLLQGIESGRNQIV
jgi:hypothetical protein